MNHRSESESVEDLDKMKLSSRGINSGNVISWVVTVFTVTIGLVWQASFYRERQSLAEARQASDNEKQTTSLASARKEFRDALSAQNNSATTALAAQVSSIGDVRQEFRAALESTTRSLKDLADSGKENLALQQKLTDARIGSLEQGQRDSREIVAKLATLEAKVEGVRDVVSELRRNSEPTSSKPRS